MNYNNFGYWLAGVQIEGMSIEMGDDTTRDFITFHTKDSLSPDVIIDSRSGHSRLVEISGELEHLIDRPLEGGYAATAYYQGEWTSTFIVRSDLGEVSFTWVGQVGAGDVEIRTC